MSPKTDRFEVRVTSQNREQIRSAAETVSESTSDFIRNAALERADKILALSSRTLMPADQFDALIQSLDTPDDAPDLTQLAAEPRRFSRQ
jgi:uncharacterized protein (DUF1778 family)